MADVALRLGRDVLVIQGAMGTMLEAEGFGPSDEICYPFLNLTEPESVEELHRRYLAAGADCAVTNTFLATSSCLAKYDLVAYTDDINVAGVRLARAAGFSHVLGAIGPAGIDADDPIGSETAAGIYQEQAAALASVAPDALYLETFTDLDDALAAIRGCQQACELPLFVCLSFLEDGAAGLTVRSKEKRVGPAEAARILEEAGAAAVGCNCMSIDDSVSVIEAMAPAVEVALIACPNAGIPVPSDDGTELVWPDGPDEFADAALRLLRAGATVIGSCCGSTPACTGAIYATVGGLQLPEA